MSRRTYISLITAIALLVSAGFLYLAQSIFLRQPHAQLEVVGGSGLVRSTFEKLETNVLIVVFSNSTTRARAKEILSSHKLDYPTTNYEGWRTSARIYIRDSNKTAQSILSRVRTFQHVYAAYVEELSASTQSSYPETEKYFIDIEFIDGMNETDAQIELNVILQQRLTTMPKNPEIGSLSSRTEILGPRKDIHVSIENLTSEMAYKTCQQLLTNVDVVSCTPLRHSHY